MAKIKINRIKSGGLVQLGTLVPGISIFRLPCNTNDTELFLYLGPLSMGPVQFFSSLESQELCSLAFSRSVKLVGELREVMIEFK